MGLCFSSSTGNLSASCKWCFFLKTVVLFFFYRLLEPIVSENRMVKPFWSTFCLKNGNSWIFGLCSPQPVSCIGFFLFSCIFPPPIPQKKRPSCICTSTVFLERGVGRIPWWLLRPLSGIPLHNSSMLRLCLLADNVYETFDVTILNGKTNSPL